MGRRTSVGIGGARAMRGLGRRTSAEAARLRVWGWRTSAEAAGLRSQGFGVWVGGRQRRQRVARVAGHLRSAEPRGLPGLASADVSGAARVAGLPEVPGGPARLPDGSPNSARLGIDIPGNHPVPGA